MLPKIIQQYLKLFPEEQSRLQLLQDQIKNGEELNNRRNFNGHITGSGLVLSPDRTKLLLINHKVLGLWLQPGGHWEPSEANPRLAAIRETQEETSIQIAESIPVLPDQILVPLDIDTHHIPANNAKKELEHWHHDFRYVFIAKDMTFTHQAAEVSSAKWFDLHDPLLAFIQRSINKMKTLKII